MSLRLRFALTCILLYFLAMLAGRVQAAPLVQRSQPAPVVVLAFSGAVTPTLEQYLQQGIDTAIARQAEAIVLQIDTPGGSVDVTRRITQKMLASPVPIIVYVAPGGAQAASAGTFITLAGHAAAMAPAASIGAASPVDASGQVLGETAEAKAKNILSAEIESLAEPRGPDAVTWAVAAVQEAAAATAARALELGVVDFIAADLPDLLRQADGFEVQLAGRPRVLQTAGANTVSLEMNPVQRFLNFIANPTIASLLLTLGTLGLIVELRSPGLGAPGVVGAISLLLGFYSLGQLDASVAGLALLVVAIALFIAETFTPTFGVLALGGAVAFILGAFLLFDSPTMRMPWPTVIALALGAGGFAVFAGAKGLAAQRQPPLTGSEWLVGQTATAKLPFRAGGRGSVFVAGEWWNAELESGEVLAGEEVLITDRRGYVLLVRKQDAQPASSAAPLRKGSR